jgi:hypothetical protein
MLVHRLTALGSFLIAIGMYAASVHPGDEGYDFPKTIAVALIALTGLLTVLSFKPGQPIAGGEERIPWGRIWPGLLVFTGYLLLAQRLGFFLSSFLAFFTLVMIYAPGRLGWHRVAWGGGIGLIFMGVLYLIFIVLLNVQMPRGILI